MIRDYGVFKEINILFDSMNDAKEVDLARLDIVCVLRQNHIHARTTTSQENNSTHLIIKSAPIVPSEQEAIEQGPFITFNGLGPSKVGIDGFFGADLPKLYVNLPKLSYVLSPVTGKFDATISTVLTQRDLTDTLNAKYPVICETLKSYCFKGVSMTLAIDTKKRVADLIKQRIANKQG